MTPHAWSAAYRQNHQSSTYPTHTACWMPPLTATPAPVTCIQHATALSPPSAANQAAGERLRYTIAPCPLGQILLASSTNGVCAVLLADEPATCRLNCNSALPLRFFSVMTWGWATG